MLESERCAAGLCGRLSRIGRLRSPAYLSIRDFSSWSIHMAFIIVFSNLWGIFFHEWHGTSRRTKMMVWCGLITLVGSTMVIGYGNYLAK